MKNSPHIQVALLGDYGLAWPWESLHVEALAWFDQWLKDRDTGVLEGPPIRYVVEGDPTWRTYETWPPPEARYRDYALGADGVLGGDGGPASRRMMVLGTGMGRARASEADPPDTLLWDTPPLAQDLDVAGGIELRLDAGCSAPDVAWILCLQDVDPAGKVTDITQGFARSLPRTSADESLLIARRHHGCLFVQMSR